LNGYKHSKKRAIPHFSVASSKFCGKWQIPWRGVKIRMPQNTAGTGNNAHKCSYAVGWTTGNSS